MSERRDPPAWAKDVPDVRLMEFIEKYRRRAVHEETGLPFAPTGRGGRPFTIEHLAFRTGPGLRLALQLFMPMCAVAFGLSFLWDWHSLLRSCSVAGAIGFGTNWIAIKMLFWPRQPRPVFGHGLIPSQRDQLIDKVATEVLEKLINETLILRKIEETKLVQRFTASTIEKLRVVTRDPEFEADLRSMILTYVAELSANPAFRKRLSDRVGQSVEDFAGERMQGWLVKRMRRLWRPQLQEIVERELDDFDVLVDEGLEHLDEVVERLPKALESRQEEIEQIMTTMLIGLVREVDLRAIVLEQLATVTTEDLETGFREFSDDKLSYITILGGGFGLIGGSVIVWPLPSLGLLVAAVALAAVVDQLAIWVQSRLTSDAG